MTSYETLQFNTYKFVQELRNLKLSESLQISWKTREFHFLEIKKIVKIIFYFLNDP